MSICLECGNKNTEECKTCCNNYINKFIPISIDQINKSFLDDDSSYYEIRKRICLSSKTKEKINDFDIVRFEDDRKYCFSIAFLVWNKKDHYYKIESVGLRLAEYGTTKLLKWINDKAIELTNALLEMEN